MFWVCAQTRYAVLKTMPFKEWPMSTLCDNLPQLRTRPSESEARSRGQGVGSGLDVPWPFLLAALRNSSWALSFKPHRDFKIIHRAC